jgi:PAS domain S-box-containing protein
VKNHAERGSAELISTGGTGSPHEGANLYSHLVASVRDYAIFVLDATGHVLTWNIGAQRIKGYSAEEIIGKHFSIFYPPEDNEAGKTAFELKVAAKEGRFEDEDWRLRKDGTRFWANVIITALRDEHGTLIGFAKVTRDLTERRAAEERALADAQRVAAAEAANRAKSEFLTMLSHELRTPLNAIAGYVQLLDVGVGGTLTAQQHEYLDRIRNSQQHLYGIINDLLNYSRIEASKVSFDIGPVVLHSAVDRALRMVQPQASMKHQQLQHGPCGENIVALAEEAKLEQVLLNLLANAVKFTPAGGTITVQCGESGDRACITVADTGPGIASEHLSSIFEPFVQVGRKLSSASEGVGLGLAISRELARGMGGDLTVESTLGKGATFTVSLPLARQAT